MYADVIHTVSDYLKEKAVELNNIMSSISSSTIRTIDKIIPFWSSKYAKQHEIDQQYADASTAYINMFVKLINSHKENQLLITENFDKLIFSNDWKGFITLCEEKYNNSSKELKKCVENLYQFAHDAKMTIQGDDYKKIVSPRVIEFISKNKGKTIDEICDSFKINLENITWSEPDDELYFNVMNKHFNIDSKNTLETKYIKRDEFTPVYPYIDAKTAFDKGLTSEFEYHANIANEAMEEKQSKNESNNPYSDSFNEIIGNVTSIEKPCEQHIDYMIQNSTIRPNDIYKYTPLLNDTINSQYNYTYGNNTFGNSTYGNSTYGNNNGLFGFNATNAYNNFIDTAAPYVPQILSLLFTGLLGKRMINAYRQQQQQYELPIRRRDEAVVDIPDYQAEHNDTDTIQQEGDIENNQQPDKPKRSSILDYIPFLNNYKN